MTQRAVERGHRYPFVPDEQLNLIRRLCGQVLTLSSRTLVMEKRGTMPMSSSSARKVSSSGVRLD